MDGSGSYPLVLLNLIVIIRVCWGVRVSWTDESLDRTLHSPEVITEGFRNDSGFPSLTSQSAYTFTLSRLGR